ncbi:MAG: hypothetical protein KC733_03310 [Candidatus Omnitrophica bacterium]|nr:hypothetical protein [Candidatus Omnitrophota bacterium]
MIKKIFLAFIINWIVSSPVLAQTLHDVRPPVKYPVNFWIFWICIFLAFLFIGAVLLYLKKKRKQVKTEKAMEPVRVPWEIALERLEALQQKQLLEKGLFNQYYTEVSDITRYYCEDRFAMKAPEMTTEEFLYALKESNQLNSDQKVLLKDFLTQCDLVKFAKYAPTIDEAKRIFNAARQFIVETKEEKNVEVKADGV